MKTLYLQTQSEVYIKFLEAFDNHFNASTPKYQMKQSDNINYQMKVNLSIKQQIELYQHNAIF